jgi:hypothetical protein
MFYYPLGYTCSSIYLRRVMMLRFVYVQYELLMTKGLMTIVRQMRKVIEICLARSVHNGLYRM